MRIHCLNSILSHVLYSVTQSVVYLDKCFKGIWEKCILLLFGKVSYLILLITDDIELNYAFPGLPWGLRICLQCGRPIFDCWVRKIHWRREWQLTLVFLPGESQRQQSLVGYCLSMEYKRIGRDWATTLSIFMPLLAFMCWICPFPFAFLLVFVLHSLILWY